ncbi:zinc finger BED domain-containing protein RICESLEEPER 2 [Tanacetum coccineum]
MDSLEKERLLLCKTKGHRNPTIDAIKRILYAAVEDQSIMEEAQAMLLNQEKQLNPISEYVEEYMTQKRKSFINLDVDVAASATLSQRQGYLMLLMVLDRINDFVVLRKYFENMPPIITYSAALNPCFNVSGVDYLIENISRDLEFHIDGFATRTYQKKARNDPTMSSEYEQYLKADFVSHLHPKDFATFDVLGFWKAKENQFPVLSRMAMDILSVQASSVASESAFSTSGRLLTIRRTRLTPESLEMCMCLKDHLDAQERKQDTSPLELPLDVEEGVFNVEVQQNEATQLTDQEIALDASSDGSSGEPRHDYMMSSGAEDDQTGDGHDGSMSHGYY